MIYMSEKEEESRGAQQEGEIREPIRRRVSTILNPRQVRALEQILYKIPTKEVRKWRDNYINNPPDEVKSLRENLQDVLGVSEYVNEERDELNRLYQDSQVEIQRLNRTHTDLTRELTRITQERNEVNETFQTVLEVAEGVNEELNRTKRERNRYRKQVEEANRNYQIAQQEIARLRGENQQLQKERDEYAKNTEEALRLLQEYNTAFGESTAYFGNVIKDTKEKKDRILRILKDPQ